MKTNPPHTSLLSSTNFSLFTPSVGFVYTAKAKHYLASTGMLWGIGGLYHSATNSMHVLRETVSTVRAALELKTVFEELAKAETEGITEDRKKELEEEAATKG